ncbi:hypothetical protein Cni_G22063 [Canna indica]|uniref:4-coumarate--CoA ligase n=1 Tax=Canna indica TaxID=4628 RepID=A0AAQ3KRU5_9LILI|nr:hypothetical protein Cni_G22063 [Canna indica]
MATATLVEHYSKDQVEDDDHWSCFCPKSGIFRSPHRLASRHHPPSDPDLDAASFILSLLPSAHSPRPAFLDSVTGRCVTFSDLHRSVLSLASTLRLALDLRPGDVVLLLSPNSVIYPAIVLAVLASGAVLSPASPLCTPSEIARQARDSGAVLAIATPEEAHKLVSAGVPTLLTHRSPEDRDGPPSVEEMMECSDPLAAPPPARGKSDVAAVLYSSGTTGAPKGVVLTHGNLIAMVSLLRWSAEVSGAEDDVYLAFIPMYHVYGLAFFALGLPSLGATTVVMSRFDLEAAMEAVARHGVTNIPAVPPVVVAMAKSSKRWDLSGLRRVGTGAAALGAEAARRFRRRYPWAELREGYGLTESGGAATFAVVASRRAEGRGVGQLLPGFEARVVAPATGKEEGPGGVGELWLRGPTVMREYLGDEAATAAELVGGEWLRTGDLVYFDEEGFLFIVDRIKEHIKHNGYQVWRANLMGSIVRETAVADLRNQLQVTPSELEALLLTHPHILDAAVVPLEDEEAGQVPMAYLVRSTESQLTSEEVIQFVASQVAPHKKIRRVAFISSIPRSPAGKILRKELIANANQAVLPKL